VIPSFVTYWSLRDLAARFAAPRFVTLMYAAGRDDGFVTLMLPTPAEHFVTAETELQEVVESFVTE